MMIKRFFLMPILDLAAGLEKQLLGNDRRGVTAAAILLSAVVTWFVYVPIHELLHAAGCVVTGGTVTELQIDGKYGGALLAEVFPFVTSGSDYAGRLTGWDTGGSDFVYLMTDFAPFILSVLIGVPLLKLAGRRRSSVIFGMSLVVGLAPLTNLTGDYYEMGSVVVTRVGMMLGSFDAAVGEALRSDDVFRFVEEWWDGKGALEGVGGMAVGIVLVLSAVLAIVLAWGTYWMGVGVSQVVLGADTADTSHRL